MDKKKIAFFDAKPYDIVSFDEVNKSYGFEIKYFPGHITRDNACLSNDYDALCIFVNDIVDKSIVDILLQGKIQVIALRCAGYNNVDLKAIYGKIHAVRVPAYSPYAVAEHATALMMALNRKVHRAYHRVRDGNFSINGFLGFDMHGKTIGVVGAGKIGRCMIAIARGFGMEVLVYDNYKDEAYAKAQGIRYAELDELYRKADIITLHCPLTPGTNHMIDAAAIDQMKPGVMVINTGRGKLIDTMALIGGLKSGKIGAAGLDVYEEESTYFFEDFSASMISDDVLARLLTFPNVLVTSHQAFFTKEALHNIADTTLSNIKEFFAGGYLKNEICYHCDKDCLKKQGKRCF